LLGQRDSLILPRARPEILTLLLEAVASGFSFGDVDFSFSGILIDSEENI